MVALDLQDVLDQRRYDKTVRRGQKNELGNGLPRIAHRPGDISPPHLPDLVTALLGVDVHSLDLIADLQGEAQTLFGDAGPAIQRNDDERLREVIDAHRAIEDDLSADAVVMAFDRAHEDDQRRNKDGR